MLRHSGVNVKMGTQMIRFRSGFEGLEHDKIIYQEREFKNLNEFLDDIARAIQDNNFKFMWIEKEKVV